MKILYILLIICVFFAGFYSSKMFQEFSFGAMEVNYFNSATNGTAEIGATAKEVLPANTGRIYLNICNVSSTTAYIHLASSSSSVAIEEGVLIEQNDCYEINPTNMYVGAIWGVASASTTLSYVEK